MNERENQDRKSFLSSNDEQEKLHYPLVSIEGKKEDLFKAKISKLHNFTFLFNNY